MSIEGTSQPQPQINDPRTEITALLEADATRLGEVFRLDRDGKTPYEIAEELGVETTGFVSNYKTTASSILDGIAPISPTLSGQIASRVRKWLKTYSFTEPTERHLRDLLVDLELRAENSSARTAEDSEALKQTEIAETRQIPGVYVYALPHYIRHPIDPDTGRTYLKVGHSGRDAFGRAHSQGRITALPEDPVLLRIYETATDQSAAYERIFHDWLGAADHTRNRTLRGGSEWFLTSTRFLDQIAKTNNLKATVVYDVDASDV